MRHLVVSQKMNEHRACDEVTKDFAHGLAEKHDVVLGVDAYAKAHEAIWRAFTADRHARAAFTALAQQP